MTSALSENVTTTNSEGNVVLFQRDEYTDITPFSITSFLYESYAEAEISRSVRNYIEVLEENRELKRQLEEIQQDLVLATAAAQLSESSLGEVWSNPEDAAYDDL